MNLQGLIPFSTSKIFTVIFHHNKPYEVNRAGIIILFLKDRRIGLRWLRNSAGDKDKLVREARVFSQDNTLTQDYIFLLKKKLKHHYYGLEKAIFQEYS